MLSACCADNILICELLCFIISEFVLLSGCRTGRRGCSWRRRRRRTPFPSSCSNTKLISSHFQTIYTRLTGTDVDPEVFKCKSKYFVVCMKPFCGNKLSFVKKYRRASNLKNYFILYSGYHYYLNYY